MSDPTSVDVPLSRAILVPLFLLDVVLWFFSFAWVKNKKKDDDGEKRMYSVPYGEGTSTHGPPRRSPGIDTLVTSIYDGGKALTVYDMTRAAIAEYGTNVAMVTRNFVELKKVKETDRFPTKIFDDVSSPERITYEELGPLIAKFGAGLRAIGMEPIPQLKEGQHFDDVKGKFVMLIFEDTCKQWTIAFQGACTQSITVATCYATLGEDAVVSSVNETGATAMLLNWKKATKFANMAKKMPTLKTIIASTHEMPVGTPTPVPPEGSGVTIISTDELIELGGEKASSFPPVPPKPHDVAVIMYTSGSTGKPKGVVMRHSQMVAAVSGMAMNVHLLKGEDVYVSYLPLAHVLALQIEVVLLNAGARICYSDPRQLAKALAMFRPTLHAGVPKVWELLKAGVEHKVGGGPKAVKLAFDGMVKWKVGLRDMGMDTPATNFLFAKVAEKVFGGVLRFGVSGGGPMSESLSHFSRAVFCCPIIQGYALTETCVGGCFQDMDDARPAVVGPPVPCVEIMLQSEPDIKDGAGLPYLHTDTVGSKGESVIGRGEICMRGPCISSGYYKNPDKTKEEYDAEGFFHTGDIGQFTADGVIQIIDRKKNLVKLKGGEYVAVEAMETAFAQSPFVSAVCVVANGDLDRPLAIVRADNGYLKEWAAGANVVYDKLQVLADMDGTRKAAVKSMVAAGKEGGLAPLELKLADCAIVTDVEWGPGNGLTATMKIDRRKIFSMHEKELNEMLKRNGAPPVKS